MKGLITLGLPGCPNAKPTPPLTSTLLPHNLSSSYPLFITRDASYPYHQTPYPEIPVHRETRGRRSHARVCHPPPESHAHEDPHHGLGRAPLAKHPSPISGSRLPRTNSAWVLRVHSRQVHRCVEHPFRGHSPSVYRDGHHRLDPRARTEAPHKPLPLHGPCELPLRRIRSFLGYEYARHRWRSLL